ncbi:MAG: hypothetical protein ABR529_12115 [Actinomycetota bacterium]
MHAAAPAAVLSGVPSTLHALITRCDRLEASLAAGSILLPCEKRWARLLAAAVPVHLGVSVFWALVLSAILPRKKPLIGGALAGMAIAAVDLGVFGRRFHRVRRLPVFPQLADHIAFGVVAAAALARRFAAPAR